MPPRAVWKIRPSRVVPNLLAWARSSRTGTRGMGMVADLHLPKAGWGRIVLSLAEHDRLQRAQRCVVEAGEERLQVLCPLPQPPGGVQERLGLGSG